MRWVEQLHLACTLFTSVIVLLMLFFRLESAVAFKM